MFPIQKPVQRPRTHADYVYAEQQLKDQVESVQRKITTISKKLNEAESVIQDYEQNRGNYSKNDPSPSYGTEFDRKEMEYEKNLTLRNQLSQALQIAQTELSTESKKLEEIRAQLNLGK